MTHALYMTRPRTVCPQISLEYEWICPYPHSTSGADKLIHILADIDTDEEPRVKYITAINEMCQYIDLNSTKYALEGPYSPDKQFGTVVSLRTALEEYSLDEFYCGNSHTIEYST